MFPQFKTCALIVCFGIFAQPIFGQCAFTFTPAMPCPGEVVTFKVTPPANGTVYKWDLDGIGGFNDGMGSTQTFIYPYSATSTNYTVKLEKDGVPCPVSQMITVKAGQQPKLGVASGGTLLGNVISTCSGSPMVTLSVYNDSQTPNDFLSYSIDWGDNTPVGNYNNLNFSPSIPVLHTYSGVGYKTITLSATHNNNCVLTKTYQFFNGTNPAIGMGNPGGAVGLCAPHTLNFPLSGYANNAPGTTYTFKLNGIIVGTFDQSSIQSSFSYTFNESSCGQTPVTPGFTNAFEMSVTAENPCFKSAATIVPITLSTKPIPDFTILEPIKKCPGEVWTFMNSSTNINEFLSDGTCVYMLDANWSITPAQSSNNWQVIGGGLFNANKVEIRFNSPGTYSITMTLNPEPKCGPATVTKIINVLEPPDAIALAQINPTDGCSPLTVHFENNSTGYMVGYNWHISPGNGWSWQSPNSGTNDVSTPEPTAIFTVPGTYSVTLTASNVCSTDTWVTQIVVKGNPTVTLPTLGPFCMDATLNLTPAYGNGGGTNTLYEWSFPGGTPSQFTGPNPTNIKYGPVTVATTFTYTVSVTNECGTTTASKTFEIQVPATISLPPDMTVCVNATAFQISPVVPLNGTWSGPGVAPGGLFTPANAGSPGIKKLTYTYGSGGACTAIKDMYITIIALPSVNAGADLKKCVSDPIITLGGTPVAPPGTGIWTSSPSTPGLSGGNFNPAIAGAGPFILTYTYTDLNSCKNSAALTITVNNLPVINTNDAAFCLLPVKVPLPNATPIGGTWSGPGVVGNQFDPILVGLGVHTAVYTYTDMLTMCTNSKSINITVGPPEIINAGPDKDFCKNDPPYNLNLDATNSNGATWSGPGVSGGFFDPAATTGTGQFTIKLEKGADNCKVTDERIMTVHPIPAVIVPTIAKSCISETTVALPPTIPTMGGTWTSIPPGLVLGNSFYPSSAGLGDFILTYTFTDPLTLCTNNAELKMTVNPLPDIKVGDTIYCNTIGAIDLPFATPQNGMWMGPGIANNQFDPMIAGGIGNYTATYSFLNTTTGCSNKKDINIEVISPENIDAGPDKVFCLNDLSFDLDSDATNSGGGFWSGPGVSGNIFTPSVAGIDTIVLKKGPGNCQVVDERIFKVNPLPAVEVPAIAKSCVSETSVQLPLPTQPSTGGGIWSSSPAGLVSGAIFLAKMAGQGNFILTYTFTDNNNCTNSDILNMTVNPLPIVTASDAIFCNTSEPVPMPAATPLNGDWSGTGISGNEFYPNTAGGVGVYQTIYTFTDANNCTNRDTAHIEVIAPEIIDAGANKVFCLDDMPFDLDSDATNSGGGFWSGPGVSGHFFTPAAAGAGTHQVILKKGIDNCEVVDQREMTVNPLPVVDVPLTQQSCVNETAIMLPATTPASGGTWTCVPPGLVTGNIFNPALAGANNFTITYSFIDTTTGCKNSDSLLFSVHPLPIPLSQDTSFCNTQGEVKLPVATPNSGGMGWWTGVGTSGFNFDPIGAGGVGDYPQTYHYTDQNGCTDSITIIVTVTEPIPAIAGPNDTLCIFDGLLQLTGFTPASGGQWSGAGITNPTTGVFDPLVTGGGLHPLIYSFGVGNCNQLDTSTVLVIAVNIEAGPDRAVCAADAPFALNNFNPATGGSWTGVGITNSAGNFDPGTAGVGSHVLNYAFVDPVLGCTFKDTLTIVVHPMPESDFAPLTATCIDELIQFQNLSISTFDVLWDFGDGQTSTLAQPTHTYTDTGTYTIQLTTTTEFGCSDMRTRTIFVTEPPFAFFTPLPDSGCAVLPVLFKNDSYGWQTTYNWAFGNIQTDSLYTPGLVLLPGGTKDTFYIVTLTATNLCAVRTWTDSILVHPLPIVAFGTSTDTICSGGTILFANTSLGQPETFVWDFGNGQTSTDSLPNPMFYFTDTVFRTYTIRLIATNFCGSDTLERDITVKPVDVRSFFNVPNLIGCEPYTVQFSNFATPGANVFWQFGDGNTSSLVNPQHTFQDPGTYKVVQKVSAGCGFDSTIAYITVKPAPEVSFVCLPQICKEADMAFTNTSLSPLSGVHWDFGDGDSSLLNNPTHSFDNAGISTVVLTGISAVNGCPGTYSLPVNVLELPNVNIITDKPDGCVPLSIEFQIQAQGATYFEWNFGDGNTALGTMPSHTFNAPGQYEIYLEGIDLNGCRNDTLLRYITVHPIPTPAFTMQPDRLCGLPVVVDFTNNTPDAVGYTWTFGDLTGTSVVNNPQHSYPQPGDYLVQLIAENAFMCKDTAAQTFSAYAQPVADFLWDPEEGCAPLTVLFENLSTFSTSAYWTFSDGGHSDTLTQTTHTFYNWGRQGAKLLVSHRGVCFDSLALSDIIEVFPSPTANFSFQEIVTDPPSGMFEFMDLSVGAVRWLWDFGDGDSSTLQNPAHRFYSNGQKLVKLTVWGENECPDDTIQGVTPRPMHGLFIPNAFTPGLDNGDAALFQPKGVGLREFEIAVYSSFGQLLWTSGTDQLIDGQPGPGWDGNFKGTQMPQDVYTWQVKTAIFDDGTVWGGKKIGSVTLIR